MASIPRILTCLALLVPTAYAQNQRAQQINLSTELTQRLADMLAREPKANDDWSKMASQILAGQNTMGIGNGWYKAPAKAVDWAWLRATFDTKPRNNRVTRRELPDFVTDTQFKALDRDDNGSITAADLRWEKNHIMEGNSPSNVVFNRLDADMNGRISRAEFDKFFEKNADGFDYLTPDDLMRGLKLPTLDAMARGQQPPTNFTMPVPRRWQMLDMLLRGDLGNLEPGPEVGDDAPDFNLPLLVRNEIAHKLELSSERVVLSEAKGKRPVVLIFGSFT